MLPAHSQLTKHSILGSVSDYYQQQALQEDTENEDITLKLPPIFPHRNTRQSQENDRDDHGHGQRSRVLPDSLQSPTIPSIFSPKSTNRNPRQRNKKDLIRGQQIEKKKEHRKLQQLLKGDRIYATREERVLRRWRKQQKEWQHMKQNIAQKIGKSTDDLVITRTEEWREMVEEIDLMTKSVPLSVRSFSHWQQTLRMKTGMEEHEHLVPIGNMFSGLYCRVTEKPRNPIKETVRKPRKLSMSLDGPLPTESAESNTENNLFFHHYNVPGKGAASKRWRERSVTYQFRKKLHKRMLKLKPNNLDELDGLEIVGHNMFSIDTIPLPSYSYERLIESQALDKREQHELENMKKRGKVADDWYECKDTQSQYLDDESYDVIEADQVPIIGPAVQFTPGELIAFDTVLYQEQTRVLEIRNIGTTAVLLRFENVKQEFKEHAIFLYPTEQFSILPGDTKSIAVYFKPTKPGAYHLVVGIESLPCISQRSIELHAICKMQDEDAIHREHFMKQLQEAQMQQEVGGMLRNMVDSIPEPDPKMQNIPKSFCECNRDHRLYWHPGIMEQLTKLSDIMISKFRRRKRMKYRWDLSVTMLKQWLRELQEIHPSAITQPLEDELLSCIERAQVVPPPNPLYYDLCSSLINDLALQIPRFSWRAAQSATISYKQEQEKARESKQQQTAEEEQTDANEDVSEESSDAEWNVLESEHYQTEMQQACKQYFHQIMNEFENGIIDESEINHHLINPIKSKLNPKAQSIYTFGCWLRDTDESQTEHTDVDESAESKEEQPAAICMQTAEIVPLQTLCIQSIHSNSNVTILTAPYQAWICPNNQSFEIPKETVVSPNSSENETADQEAETEEEETTDAAFNELESFPIWKGFNIVQVYCCENMVNVLTDTGDVYCSVFSDLATHQTEILFNQNIVKITGCSVNNKCVALSESGRVYEWSLITESANSDTTESAKTSGAESEEQEPAAETLKISPVTEWPQIDVKLKDVAITSTAYAGITEESKLIIWGDFKAIYGKDVDEEEDSKKKKKAKSKAKPKAKKTEEKDAANLDALPAYLYVESKQPDIDDESERSCLKYQQVVSCSDSFAVLDESGNVYSFGKDEFGALGLGEEIKKCGQPKMIVFDEPDSKRSIRCLSSWIHGCLAMDHDGDVWYWGKGFGGETEVLVYVPVKIETNGKCNQVKKCAVSTVGGFLWTN
eukprot:CAMPEP_0197032516 /NCGR_PEP_ID=MMETSP1384-20130603/11179_1 /TAXON_ID=29189 /ORGANISM="Ammonia sp." /LENGTH=1196 /DNA_ID=CAMNT_0042462197 /DNA_START=51 /DNA_END=3641 /DNA_ORIENTATION=-